MADLFSPLEFKGLKLKNRVAMPPMANDRADERGFITEPLVKHYVERAANQVGLMTLEHSYVRLDGRYTVRQTAIDRDEVVPGLAEVAEKVHREGAVIGMQITHAGGRTKSENCGTQPIAPSPLQVPAGSEIPRQVGLEEIPALVEAFAQAAARVKAAGFDFVEIHGAHGYLLNEFWSPLTNQRKDAYGGSRENRLRLPLEVVEAVRAVVGADFAVFCRFGADDRLPGGNTIQDSCWAAPRLVEAGVDLLDLSGGLCGYLKQGPQGFFVYMAEAIKPVVKVPVLVTGGISDPHFANEVIASGRSDLVGVGRALLKDPAWVIKARQALA